MALRKCICLAILLCAASNVSVRTQQRQNGAATQTDPFTIIEGSSFSASGGASSDAPRKPVLRADVVQADFEEALEIIETNYASQTNRGQLTDAAIASLLKSLDPHSNYYNPAEFEDLIDEHESEYSGTGSSIAAFRRNDRIETFVISTLPDSPASKAGLKFGDRIIAVNGRNVGGESPDTIRDLVRGKRGTTARVTVERIGNDTRETIEIRRERVHEPAVPKGFLIGDRVGYIDLTSGFSNATFGELESSLAELKQKGMSSLVLDIRGNGGGILDQAVKVAEKFLPSGTTIVSQRGRYPNDSRTWKAAKTKYESMPLVLLVDEHTASASEVLAGALQDNDRALIVGEKTFGKGLVQSVLNLPDGAGLTLTAARYYTPTGRSIQRDYADTGLYDYFHHRQPIQIGTSVFAARTPTNRVVYGGDGITPDETSEQKLFSEERMSLLDPIFFFAREVISGTKDNVGSVRQKIIFRDEIVDKDLMEKFFDFAASTPQWSRRISKLRREDKFVRSMLTYYLQMGAFGADAANRARIESDPQVAQSVSLLPRSAQLSAAADRARNANRKEKSSLSLVLNEQR